MLQQAKLRYYKTCAHLLAPMTSKGRLYVVDLASTYRDPFTKSSKDSKDWIFEKDTRTCDLEEDLAHSRTVTGCDDGHRCIDTNAEVSLARAGYRMIPFDFHHKERGDRT